MLYTFLETSVTFYYYGQNYIRNGYTGKECYCTNCKLIANKFVLIN